LDDLYEAERGLLEGYAVIPLFHLPLASAVSARVRGWTTDRLGTWGEGGFSLAELWVSDQRLADQRLADPRSYGPQPEAGAR